MLTGNKQRSKYYLKISCKGVISAKKKKKTAGGDRIMQGPIVDGVVRGYLYRRGCSINTTRKENTETSMSRDPEVKRNKKASVVVAE